MSRWHLNHEYPRYYVNQLLDPDFDCLDEPLGGLTLAQIRDPVGLEFGSVVDLHQQGLDEKRHMAALQLRDWRDQLRYWSKRLDNLNPHKSARRQIDTGRQRLKLQDDWLQYRIKWRLWYERERLRQLHWRLNAYRPPTWIHLSPFDIKGQSRT